MVRLVAVRTNEFNYMSMEVRSLLMRTWAKFTKMLMKTRNDVGPKCIYSNRMTMFEKIGCGLQDLMVYIDKEWFERVTLLVSSKS